MGKAMGGPKRVELIDLLAQGERSVEALARATRVNLTTVSAHLQTLRQANLVATRREGARIVYRLAGPDVAALYLQVQRLAEHHLPDLAPARATFIGPEDAEEFAGGHLPGALCIRLERLAEIPVGADVVAYCRGPYCVISYDAVRLLPGHGRPARRLADGVLEWAAAALPVTPGASRRPPGARS